MSTNMSMPTAAKLWLFPVVISVIAVINTSLTSTTETLLRYDRELIIQGELWRLFSAHLLHLSWSHLWMNLAGLAFIFFFFGNLLSNKHWTGIFLFSSLLISVILFYTQADLRWYVGLSGVLHALFIAGGIADIRIRKLEALLFLAFILGKLLYEQLMGPLPGSEESAGGPVLVDAHLFGAICGAVYMGILEVTRRIRKN